MLNLVLAIILGGLFAYVALQNATIVPFTPGSLAFTLPLYFVAFGALLFGTLLAGIFSLAGWTASTLTIAGKDSQLNKTQKLLEDLKVRLNELEVENTQLKGESREMATAAKTQAEIAHTQAHIEDRAHVHWPHSNSLNNFLARLRYRLAI
ncbi:MAG: hypothetical protein UY21_C0012G0026 [Microgenomates group bacterium GW2011_GWA1_48_10]|uniref:Lipopolysaccharide assembly protein A domain-containing protein n=1 Tax=Candidatus Gottesmanbacteria bacterium RIFCSPHIGHO2_01_FULL_47_48 TaxID=1798381 RepID=A0A1F6A5A6_9BACT|nr:MAG: hypothetical protein UY21_C0012G0026 [Microgenomates group bacterium GW2011_GWA1_48_10]OGG19642.1 MAG: hypothetical protein A2721_00815 [Candidatus Gottesmanbacteria bacterium RIFCSPHIGHO2_01_FULL_47_48]